MRPTTRVSKALGAAALCAVFLVLLSPGTRSPDAVAAGSHTNKANGLVLVTPPSFATPQQPFVARLGLPAGVSRAVLSLDVTLYSCLGNRSEFDQTLSGNPSAFASSSQSIPVAALPAEPSGAVDLMVPVRAGNAAPAGTGPFVANLDCPQSYYGVYPLRIELTDQATSAVVGQLVTYIVYTPPADLQPLRFALIVPVSLGSRSATTGVSRAPSSTAVSNVESLVNSMSGGAGPRVPVTLLPSPSSMSVLSSDQDARPKAVPQIQQLSTSTVRQTVCGPFADVDASELVSAGLPGEISRQVREGETVLGDTIHADCTPPGGGTSAWVSDSTLDQQALTSLSSLGYERVVVPQDALAGPALSCNETRLFDLGDTRAGSLPAAVIDAGISSRLATASRSDPALAAQQVVAELEQIYYDAPNTSEPRGVVALAPAQWGSNPAFVSDLMDALADNPMVRPVTLDDLFSATDGVPIGGVVGGCALPTLRRPASDGSVGTLPAKGIRSTRTRLEGLESAVGRSSEGAVVVQGIDQELLESESSTLSAEGQRAALAAAERSLGGQLRSLSVTAGEISLASNAAPVPITLVKKLSYPVTAVLAVTSDKLVFPQGSQSPGALCQNPTVHSSTGRSSFSSLCDISHNTNVVYVDMRTRATGDFRISVTLTSPDGGLVLASGQLTVRSESFSAVSIGLSAAAAFVLLTWWGRTAWRRRRGRDGRPSHGRPAHGRHSRSRPATQTGEDRTPPEEDADADLPDHVKT